MANRVTRWNKRALNQFNAAIKYIAKDSLQNAENARKDILSKTEKLTANPEIYPPDKYREENDGNFRAFELHHYRISYYVSANEIRVLRVRHTKMEPKKY
jgi:plasmid stabilization system protein ParE